MIVNCGMKEKYLFTVRNEYSPQLSKLVYNWQVKIRRRSNTLKGLSEDVGRVDFSNKPPRNLL
jgi:hypothetical protein